MKKLTFLTLLMSMLASTSYAETYQCGPFQVVTGADSGIVLNGQRMKRIGADSYVLGPFLFQFQNSIQNTPQGRVLVTKAVLSANGHSAICR